MAQFGASAATPAPSPAAPSTGFSLTSGSASAAGATPAQAFASPPAQQATTNNATPQQPSTSMVVPDFDSIFPNLQIQDRIERLLAKVALDTDEGRWDQQVLFSLLQCNPADSTKSCVGHILAQPFSLPWKAANPAVRHQLQTSPVISFERTPDKVASLTPAMLQEVWSLADDLRVSEPEALALYAQASKLETRNWLKEESLAGNLVSIITDDDAGDSDGRQQKDFMTVPQAARQLYFSECHALLYTLLLLIQKRIGASQQLDTWGANFLHATDSLLQEGLVQHLIALVRDYTRQEMDLQRDIAEAKSTATASAPFLSPFTATSTKKIRLFQTVLLEFVQRERQVAAECLFFVTYHTQCIPDEAAALIDLVKDLTNQGLPGVDAFDDKLIPSPYQEAPVNQWQAPPWAQAPSPVATSLPAKDPLVWQRDLVYSICQTGQPQLLQCVSVLVLAVICALDVQHELMDRNLHGPNPFGVGNALLPPGTTDTSCLATLHVRLARSASTDWIHRKDICGLFSASYAILLRSVPTILSSPRAGPSGSPAQDTASNADFKSVWRDCLEAPTEMKSFTFARLTLVPALRLWTRPQPATPCHTDEFFFSVLAEWTSRYLEILCASGEVPISRAQWEKEQEDELALLRTQQEQQRQFRTWQGFPTSRQDEEQALPTHVDLLNRPDCMDDVIALAVAVCSAEPDFSSSFWSVEESQEGHEDAQPTFRLVPSRALRDLKRLLQQDRSLLPAYLSFLASLALVGSPATEEIGADVVHRILSEIPDNDSNGTVVVNWKTLMETLRWYARELSPHDYNLKSSSNTSKSSSFSATDGSTAYYYGAENLPGSSSSGVSSQSGGASASNASKPMELGDANTLILLSHLAVISNVASNLPAARSAILGIKLPVEGSQEGRADTALTILFSLSIDPLTPEVRGAVFATIASLLRVDHISNEDQINEIKGLARTSWDLLEDCQVIPIGLLDQYAPPPEASQRLASNIMFPPSSISLVGDGRATAWTPNDPAYGILFEMEHVESRMGWYPSTEGLLKLLCSLVSACGCPCDLGNSKRARSGCSPYIEYVAQFVIPQVTAGKSASRLPFRMVSDKNRLLARAFEVIEAVLARYVIAPKSTPSKQWLSEHRSLVLEASTKLGLSNLAEKVVIPPASGDAEIFAFDFLNANVGEITASVFYSRNGGQSEPQNTGGGIGSSTPLIPFPKSPGFALLADALSAQGGSLFHAVSATLADHSERRGRAGGALDEIEANRFACAFGLMGELIPSISSAKTISKGALPTFAKQALLKPIIPTMEESFLDNVGVDDPTKWRERATISTLRILCAVAAREDYFLDAVTSAPGSLNFAPVLQFQRRGSVGALELLSVQPTLLKDILLLDVGATDAVRSIVDFIDYSASDEKHESDIAAPAIALAFYLHKHLYPDERDKALHSIAGRDLLPAAVAKRLLVSSELPESHSDAQIVQLILDWIVVGLRESTGSGKIAAHWLLGLPTGSFRGTWLPGHKPSSVRPGDCLDAIIQLLRDVQFITGPKSSALATTCFEILVRLCEGGNVAGVSDMQRVLVCAERLRDVDFWSFHLVALVAERATSSSVLTLYTALYPLAGIEGAENILHSCAWLLKGVANELRLLAGANKFLADVDVFDRSLRWLLAPRPRQYEKLLSFLFSSPHNLLRSVLLCVPLANTVDPESVLPSREAVEAATVSLPGPTDVVAGYKQIDYAKLLLCMQSPDTVEKAAAIRKWADQWNSRATWDCAASHLTNGVRIVLGSSFESSNWLNGEYSLLLSSNVNSLSAMNSVNLAELLSLALSRIIGEECHSNTQAGMDDQVYSMASLYISQASLVLADRVVAEKRKEGISMATVTDSDLLDLCITFAKAIVLSSAASGAVYAFSRRDERTAVLATALAAIIKSTHWVEISNRPREFLIQAGVALAHLSCQKINPETALDRQRHPPQAAVIAARSCLATMVDLFSICDDDAPREQSFGFVILTTLKDSKGRRFGEHLVDRIAALDDRVSTLMTAFVGTPFGGDLLLEYGLGKALIFAAENYASEEDRALLQFGSPLGGYRSVDIAIPTFLGEHLQVIKALLSSPFVSQDLRKSLSEDVPKIMTAHRRVIERLFIKFPVDNDVLLKCFECVVLAERPTTSAVTLTQADQEQGFATRIVPCIGFLELSIFDLTLHLLENPFPRQVLSQLPQALVGSEFSEHLHVAPVLRQERGSWWEAIPFSKLGGGEEGLVLPYPPSGSLYFAYHLGANVTWTEAKYEFSIRAMEFAALGLSILVLKANHEKFPFTTDFSVARSLCRISDAARAVEGRVGMLDQKLGTHSLQFNIMDTGDSTDFINALERKYLQSLGMKLGRCAELLLIIALLRARAMKSYMSHGSEEVSAKAKAELHLFSKAITVALEYNSIENMGIGCVIYEEGEGRREFAMKLATSLRNELNCSV